MSRLTTLFLTAAWFVPVMAGAATPASAPGASSLRPNLEGQLAQPLRYKPDNGDFVIENGTEFFNRPLYGGNTAFRVDGGDKPEFTLYLPGRGGNLRLGVRTKSGAKWLKDADRIVTRYRPGELLYEIRDPAFGDKAVIKIEVLAYAATEGLIVRAEATNISEGAELIWAYGGVNGQRGARDGDIGTEKVPISQYFQFQPEFAKDNNFDVTAGGFSLKSAAATITGVVPEGAKQYVSDAANWDDLPALLDAPAAPPPRQIVFGEAPIKAGQPLFLSLQRTGAPKSAGDLDTYREVSAPKAGTTAKPDDSKLLPAFKNSQLPEMFAATRTHFEKLRTKVRIETPDPYLNAAVGSLNVVADALWDDDKKAIMHGSIAWRTKLLGWRGPYALDALGWHDRARQNFETWLPNQNTNPVPASLPPADTASNLARNETGLHSNGDLSNSHYDMNMVFIDALFRHLLWTGDTDFARKAWPVIERHLAWEKRSFRREFGPDHLPLYEAYAAIWASDDLYYSGGGTAHASAYNLYANRMAAKIAAMIGKDPTPYTQEADAIDRAMHTLLWLPEGGFAESKDLLGAQSLHPDYALWTFYHSIDEQAATPREAWAMGEGLQSHLKPIPVEGPGVPTDRPYHVLPTSDWMPYTWSINNVVMDETMNTALALWQGGHADDAYTLAKGAILASQYMGISPGNMGTMQYLDAYRRESQRDFGDSAGTTSRTIVEGLFGIQPDALAGKLTVAPGFPADWTHARLDHPDVGLDFKRDGLAETWTVRQTGSRFKTVTLRVPAAFSDVASVTVNGQKAQWQSAPDAAGRPLIEITAKAGPATTVRINWNGVAVTEKVLATAVTVTTDGQFVQKKLGAFTWWTATLTSPSSSAPVMASVDWQTPKAATFETVDISKQLNDKVSAIFAPGKYVSPRSPGVSLALPSQGIGAWAGHVALLPKIDDNGLRQASASHSGKIVMPNGVPFATPSAVDAANIAFASQWDNYPRAFTLPLSGQARHVYLLMAGTTNPMQSRIDNGEVVVTYADGTTARLALRNPETWWPIEQDYFIDDYQFRNDAPPPPRIDLKTGQIRILDRTAFKGKGRDVDGGVATVLDLPLDPAKPLRSLTVKALSNDVVIGLMSATLERP
jgi:hypothetical protein